MVASLAVQLPCCDRYAVNCRSGYECGAGEVRKTSEALRVLRPMRGWSSALGRLSQEAGDAKPLALGGVTLKLPPERAQVS